MDARHLKRRHRTWFVRVAVPAQFRKAVGKAEIVRSLKTDSLREANRLKHAAIAQITEDISRAALGATLPKHSADYVVAVAKELRQSVLDGIQTADAAEAGLDEILERHLDSLRDTNGIDSETGDPIMPDAHARTLRLAHRVFKGDEDSLISAAVAKYLNEVKPRITKSGFMQKRRQLEAFVEWIGADAEVGSLTRKQTGRYVADVIQPADKAPKTKKDWIANLTAFGSWLEQYGLVEANPWRNLTRTIRESSRGGRPKPRPYTPDEFAALVRKLPAGTPLLPLACIGAYSGMRIEEIASAKLENVTADAIRITEGKNENSVRYVPIHPVIAPMIRRLRKTSSDGFLISGLLAGGGDSKRSHYASRAFGTFLRANGFEDRTLNFHSLRRSFTQRCENAGVPESTAKLLTGHSRQSLTYGLYSPGVEFEELTKAVAKVTYGADVDALVRSLAPAAPIKTRTRRRYKRSA